MAKEPMTVGELIERLRAMDPAAMVYLDCEDSYYSDALFSDKIEEGCAALIGAHEAMSPDEDAYGKKVQRKKEQFPDRWELVENAANSVGEIVETRKCLVIRLEGLQ